MAKLKPLNYFHLVEVIDFERACDSMREITDLKDHGLIRVPPIEILALGAAAQRHRMIETGRGSWSLTPGTLLLVLLAVGGSFVLTKDSERMTGKAEVEPESRQAGQKAACARLGMGNAYE